MEGKISNTWCDYAAEEIMGGLTDDQQAALGLKITAVTNLIGQCDVRQMLIYTTVKLTKIEYILEVLLADRNKSPEERP